MATNLKDALSKKRAQKAVLTKLRNKLAEPDLSFSDLELLKTKFKNLQDEFNSIFDSVVNLSSPDNVDKAMDEQDEVNAILIDVEFEVNSKLSKLNDQNKSVNSTVNTVSDNSVVRLPKISLPSYSGEIHSWLSFKDIFKASIDQNPNLSNAMKLQYLKSALKGDAFRIVQTISITDSNYQLAWSLLEERYSNVREQIYAHLKRFMNISVVQNESASAILNLIDVTSEVIRSLECLDQKLEGFSSTIFAFVLSQKLDQNTKLWWERNLKKDSLPTISELLDFLKDYARTLNATKVPAMQKRNYPKVSSLISCVAEKNENTCKLCNGEHKLYKCNKFQKFSLKDRFEFVKKTNLCFCCFGNHSVKNCRSNYSCKVCKTKHNSLICFGREKAPLQQNRRNHEIASPSVEMLDSSQSANSQELNVNAIPFVNNNNSTCFMTAASNNNIIERKVLLSTALVLIKGREGELHPARALLDNGSMIHLCSSKLAEKLQLSKENVNLSVGCFAGISTTVKSKVSAVIYNVDKTFSCKLDFYIVPKIAHLMPSTQINLDNLDLFKNIKLADPEFHEPGKIDLLLGSEIFFELIRLGQIHVPNTNLVLQNSAMGYLVGGSIDAFRQEKMHCGFIQENVETQLKKFFDLESIGIRDDPQGYDEDKALEIFNETVKFESNRYTVSLPWKKNCDQLKDNFEVAKKRLKGLERKFQFDNLFYLRYKAVLNEYLDQDIIEKVSDTSKPSNKPVFYLPHQAVYREESITTKMRIVYDASSHEVGQLSLNDCLYPGINLNSTIFQLLMYFRINRVGILADIEKAFLQIGLAEKDRDAVRFLFVKEDSKPTITNFDEQVDVYKFKRLLFGVNSSPFLLAATIKLHIQKFRNLFPDVVEVLDSCMYVDDLIFGANNTTEALKLSRDAKAVMSKASMNLRKWVTNDEKLIKELEKENFDIHPLCLNDSSETKLKVLGIHWDVKEDCLSVETASLIDFLKDKKSTKRFILKTAGKIYDPLGLITPFTVRLKFLLQKLWLRKLPWDNELPSDLNEEWTQWCNEFSELINIRVPRFVLAPTDGDIEIHVFSDASQKSYGAAVYVKVKNREQVSVNLMTSKSRVAPVKKISLPRLELLGALIASRLGTETKKVLDRKVSTNIYFWCDSKVTLYWIKGSSKRWKSFVQNRVNEIQKLTNPSSWFYCPTKSNPADLLTRGVNATSLVNSNKWWSCADFLMEPQFSDQFLQPLVQDPCLTTSEEESCLNESKTSADNDCSLMIYENSEIFDELLNISNSYYKILHVVSYLFRFVHNLKNKNARRLGPLTTEEIHNAETYMVKEIQKTEFPDELKCLMQQKNVLGKSKIKSLNPFIDQEGLLRVNGRIKHANVGFNSKFPIILPKGHKMTKLIIEHYHRRYFHLGPTALLHYVRQKFWPVQGKATCRKVVHDCIKCFKIKPIGVEQLMGELPKERVTPDFPFNCSGADFCGPFLVKYKHQRKGTYHKMYVCIFVCLVTKAVHLEIVTDLTTEAFIACLKRFVARRGLCSKLFSDNATNFTGANKELSRLHNLVVKPDDTLASYLSSEGIKWDFLPPRAPNFGGLWESGVKSFKYHFKRVLGNSRLSYEEFLTAVTQIEGILNSRPLVPLSSDSDVYDVLTPAHFLIGRPLNTVIEPNVIDVKDNRLCKWKKLTKLIQIFWKKWHIQYLNNLQQRSKWMVEKDNVKVNELVLLKDQNLPSQKWALGRIVELYFGEDKRVRVVKVKTQSGIYKRPISQICILPNDE